MMELSVSATKTNKRSGENVMPFGPKNLADVPYPSEEPGRPLPPAQVVTDLELNTILRITWLLLSATKSQNPSGETARATGELNCAAAPTPSKAPEIPLLPATVPTCPVLIAMLRIA
jgi:hypothetical protein